MSTTEIARLPDAGLAKGEEWAPCPLRRDRPPNSRRPAWASPAGPWRSPWSPRASCGPRCRHELRNGDAAWLFLVIVLVLLAVLIIGDPGRIDRDRPWLHNLTSVLIGLITLANADAAVRLVVGIVDVSNFTQNAKVLLASGAAIWLANIIAFALWFWNLDRGGPAARAAGTGPRPALIFPEMLHTKHVEEGWSPVLRRLLPLRLRHRRRLQPHRCVGGQDLGEAHDDGRVGHLPRGRDPRRRPCRQHLEMTAAGRAKAAPGRSTNNDGDVHVGGRVAALGAATLVAACLLTSCGGSSPTAAPKKAVRGIPQHDDDDRGRPDVHRSHRADDDPSAEHGPERDRAEDRRRPRGPARRGARVGLSQPAVQQGHAGQPERGLVAGDPRHGTGRARRRGALEPRRHRRRPGRRSASPGRAASATPPPCPP